MDKTVLSKPASHGTALWEVAITSVFSLIPMFAVLFSSSTHRTDGSLAPISELVGRGQLYLFVFATFGTVFWLAFVRGDTPRHGARVFLGIIAVLVMFPIVSNFGGDPTFSNILNPSLVTLSYWYYIGFLALNYLLLFYINIDPPQPKEVFDRESKDMRQRYEEAKHD